MAEPQRDRDLDSDEEAKDAREFEQARQAALRTFEVTLSSGRTEIVKAHYHDAGESASGHLQFVTVDPSGRQKISRVFNVARWDDLREVTPESQQIAIAQAVMREKRRQKSEPLPEDAFRTVQTPKRRM